MSALGLARLFLKHKMPLVLAPLLAMLLAFAFTRSQPASWRSVALMQLNGARDSSALSLPGQTSRFDRYAVAAAIDNLLTLLESRGVADAVSDQTLDLLVQAHRAEEPVTMPDGRKLDNPLETLVASWDPVRAPEVLEALASATGSVADLPMEPETALGDWLDHARFDPRSPVGGLAVQRATSVRRQSGSEVVEVSVESEYLALAVLWNDRLVAVFKDRQLGKINQESNAARAFFEEEVSQARERLQDAEERLEKFANEHDISNYVDQTRALAQHLEALGLETERAGQAAEAARAEMEDLSTMLGGEAVALATAEQVLADSKLLAMQQEVAQEQAQGWLQRAMGGMEQGAGQPLVSETSESRLEEALEAHLAQRRTGLGAHRQDLVLRWAQARVAWQGAEAGRQALKSERQSLLEETARFSQLGSELGRLEREISVAESEFLELLDALNLARLYERQMSHSKGVSLLDAPRTPREPQGSKRLVVILLAGIVTFGLVASLVVIVAFFDRSLQRLQDFKDATGKPVLGGLPRVKDPQARPAPADLSEERVYGRLLMQLAQSVHATLPEEATVQLVSVREKAGTTFLVGQLQKALVHLGHHVEVQDHAALTRSSAALRPDGAAHTLLVVPTGARWSLADDRFMQLLEQSGAPVAGVLINHLSYEAAEGLLGALPRRRSLLRRLTRRLLTARLGGQQDWLTRHEA